MGKSKKADKDKAELMMLCGALHDICEQIKNLSIYKNLKEIQVKMEDILK